MAGHYYDKQPKTESRETQVTARLRNRQYKFVGDRGVFSKNEVDFGSRLLIESFEWSEPAGDIADIGCGYGPIGIALAAETSHQVWMADVNERALALAKRNAEAAGAANTRIVESNLLENIDKDDFAAILTNPPIRAGKKVVHSLFEQSWKKLVPKGELWVVIQKKQGAPSAKEKLTSLFDYVETKKKEKGYYIFIAKKI
ncbi:class I SAM-dependent methyltransferase [Alteribacillus sp. HJP-4]|uniref:class I SAM-dependent methyltransferase n=1 Tax=Alteribacillus sp. HJP-4 TaxID=2775394 RepID=UPI0035CCD944